MRSKNSERVTNAVVDVPAEHGLSATFGVVTAVQHETKTTVNCFTPTHAHTHTHTHTYTYNCTARSQTVSSH